MQNAIERSSKKKTENLLTGVSNVEGKGLTQERGLKRDWWKGTGLSQLDNREEQIWRRMQGQERVWTCIIRHCISSI